MKLYIFLILMTASALAVPVLNESVATNTHYTIYPDHQDKDLYYLTPKYMGVADYENEPLISYTEYKAKRKRVYAILNVVLRVKNYKEELEHAKQTILSFNPKAKFSLIPFGKSYVKLFGRYKSLVFSHHCDHAGGVYGSEQGCTFKLNNLGAYTFKRSIHKPTAFLVHFMYSIEGVNLSGDGSYIDVRKEYSISGRIGGEYLTHFPHLFTNRWGEPIDLKDV